MDLLLSCCFVIFFLQVNSVEVELPHEEPFFGYVIKLAGNFIELTTKFGLIVKYDGIHYVRVGVPDNYKEKVEGILRLLRNKGFVISITEVSLHE